MGAQRRAGAGDPRGAGEDELGADAADLSDRPASLDGLEGAAPSRPLAAAALLRAPDHAPLRVGRGRRAAAHRRLLELAKFDQPGHWATGNAPEQRKPREPARPSSSASSTTTPGSPTASCTRPRTRPTSRPPSARRRLVSRAGLRPGPGRDVRQREVLRHQPRSSATRSPSSTPATSSSRPTRHAGTARSNASSAPSTPNGPTAASGPTAPPRPRPVIVPPLLQPQATTLSRQRPTTHQPRSPSPRSRTPSAGRAEEPRTRDPYVCGPARASRIASR